MSALDESTDYRLIELEVDRGVATIALNQPDRLNVFSAGVYDELGRAFEACEADDNVRAIVIYGKGRVFSAGAELGSFTGDNEGRPRRSRSLQLRPWTLRTPIIAAIHGAAVGIGLTMPLTWDVRFVAKDAKLQFPFARRGLNPEAGSSWTLSRIVGISTAMELMLSGRFFNGDEAVAMGLASRALPADEVLPAALEYARDIAENTSPLTVAATKLLLWKQVENADRETALALEDVVYQSVTARPDPAEGARAWRERRTPQWTAKKSDELPPELTD